MAKLTAASLALLAQAKKNKGVVNPQQTFTTGNTRKKYVSNAATGNISVNGNVVTPTSAAYKATLAAMQSDTGKKFSQADTAMTGSNKFSTNTGLTNLSSDQVLADIAQQKAERAAARQTSAANQAARSAYNSQVGNINSQYSGVYQDLARQQAQEQYKMPQLLAAQGISGGGSESALLKSNEDYNNDIATQRTAQNGAISDAYSTMANNQYNANVAGAANQSTLQSNYANQLQEAAQYKAEQEAAAEAKALAAQQTADAKKAEIYKMQLSLGAVTPEAAAYYGLTTKQLQDALYGTATTTTGTTASKKKVSSGKSSGSTAKAKTLTYAQAKAAWHEGVQTSNVADVLEAYTGFRPTSDKDIAAKLAAKKANDYSGRTVNAQEKYINSLLQSESSVQTVIAKAKAAGIDASVINAWLRAYQQTDANGVSTGYR